MNQFQNLFDICDLKHGLVYLNTFIPEQMIIIADISISELKSADEQQGIVVQKWQHRFELTQSVQFSNQNVQFSLCLSVYVGHNLKIKPM